MTRDEAERVYRETAERVGDSEPADGVLVGPPADRMASAMVAALYWRAVEAQCIADAVRLTAVTWCAGALLTAAKDAHRCL